MEGKMNTIQRNPLTTHRDGDLREAMKALQELREMISSAQTAWASGGRSLIDKASVERQIDLLERLLPDSVKHAEAVLRDEQNIRENARRDASEQTNKAREEAQKLIDDATRKAQSVSAESTRKAEESAKASANAANVASAMKAQAESDAAAIRQKGQNAANTIYAQAQQEANALIARAQQEAQMIIADAENRARHAVSTDNVHRMAVMEAAEIREQTEKDMIALRQHYVSGMCNMMGEVDDYLNSLVSAIRAERQKLYNNQ